MSFHYPSSFWLFVPFALVVAIFAWSGWRRRRDLQKLGDWRLIRTLVPIDALRRRRFKDKVALAGLFFTILAAAGPQYGNRLADVRHRGVDVFIAMDTSLSMLAEDVTPNRLERAKRSLGLLISKLAGNRVGIIAFAKRAIVQCPLTVDAEAAKIFLDILDQNSVPEQGTAIGDAIRLALAGFPKDDKAGRAIVLLTDGEDHRSDPVAAARAAKEAGVVVFTIGIGTPKGEVIKNRDEQGNVTEFHKYKGEMVVSRLDDALLTKVAEMTGGRYYGASSTDREIDEIADILNGFDKREFAAKLYERLQERFQWFVAIALLFLIFDFFVGERKGQGKRIAERLRQDAKALRSRFTKPTALAAILLLVAGLPGVLQADVPDLVREGNRLLKKKDFAGARKAFESAAIDAPEADFLPYNIGLTHLLEGNFDEAKREFERAQARSKDPVLKSRIAYNLGMTLFYQGQRDGAVDQFKECLRQNPGDEDAKYNIEYIRSGKNPKTPPPKSQSSKDKQQAGASPSPTPGTGQDEKNQAGGTPTPQPKPGQLSQEEAEQLLRMSQDQEAEKIRALRMSKPNDQKKQSTGEDW